MDTRGSLSRNFIEDYFKDIIPIAAIDIAREISEKRGFKGQQFDEAIRWKVQRELEVFLNENPKMKTLVFDQNGRDRGRAVNALKGIYEKFIGVANPANVGALVD